MTDTNYRTQILVEADSLINGERQNHYGSPHENFAAVAQAWSAYLEADVSAPDVCHMMSLLKIMRLRNGPHRDSSVDGAGYLALGAELGL